MKKIDLGIIGYGDHFERNIYPSLSKIKNINIKAVLNRTKKKNFLKNTKFYTNANQFYNQKIDMVYISVPNQLHEYYILQSLKKNIHVMCEKPFVTSTKKFIEIKKLAKKKNLLIFESFMYKFHKLFKFLDNILKSKKLKVEYLIGNFRFPFLNKKNNRYFSNLGNGFFWDAACYLLSFDNYFFSDFKKSIIINKQFIEKKIVHRGNIFIKSNKISRYYFWGDGQKYSNNIEIFFENGSMFLPFFFSKPKNKTIQIEIFNNYKKLKKKFKNEDQFKNMFTFVFQNFHKKKFRDENIKLIENQINFLKKILMNNSK